MMPNEIRRLNELLKSLRELKGLQETLKTIKDINGQRKLLAQWIRDHREDFSHLSDEDLETLREKADYDKEAWREILRQLGEHD